MHIPATVKDLVRRLEHQQRQDRQLPKPVYVPHMPSCICKRCLPVTHEILARYGVKVGKG